MSNPRLYEESDRFRKWTVQMRKVQSPIFEFQISIASFGKIDGFVDVKSYLSQMNISDSSSSQWVTMFSSEAEKILGKTAQEIGETLENDPDSVAKIFEDVQFKQFVFKCRAKMETFNVGDHFDG
jgi:hypothetical protein